MNHFQVNPIGTIHHSEEGPCIRVDNAYIPALKALEGFSHINVIWWFDRLDDEKSRSLLQTEQPYKGAPAVMGIFATAPSAPNPLALTRISGHRAGPGSRHHPAGLHRCKGKYAGAGHQALHPQL